MSISRRQALVSLAAIAGAAAWLRPANHGAPHDTYFAALNRALRASIVAQPALVIDRSRLDANIAAFKHLIPDATQRRLVAKSLPSLPLLQYIAQRTETNKFMVFHLPFVMALADAIPDADLLLGKPLPAPAADLFYSWLAPEHPFVASGRLQWLIDTPARLQEYLDVAMRRGLRLDVSLEIDVGLHRGGFRDLDQLRIALRKIRQHPEHLRLTGLMGYDAHVGKLPALVESAETTYAKSQARYQAAIDIVAAETGLTAQALCLNSAGSGTLAWHRTGSVANDFSAGSCLLKPADFDVPTLDAFVPACFIATPILKQLSGVLLPGAEPLRSAWRWLDPNRGQTLFIYGGNWKAIPWSPQGMQINTLYGRSSNQEMLNLAADVAIEVNDFVFLRPTQSEAVLLQFGDLVIASLDAEAKTGWSFSSWPVLKG